MAGWVSMGRMFHSRLAPMRRLALAGFVALTLPSFSSGVWAPALAAPANAPSGAPAPSVPITASRDAARSERSQETPVTYLQVPYRSQYDGSTYEWGNCGVAAITMAMEYYGQHWSTHAVRESINALTGNWSTKSGVDWRYLKTALERRGFATIGPYHARGGYLYWTLDDLLAQTEQGRPIILLVHYRSLPGHENDDWPGDHYIVFLGLTPDGGVIYHDPGFEGDEGANRIIDQATLDRAWSKTWVGQNRTAMAVLPPR